MKRHVISTLGLYFVPGLLIALFYFLVTPWIISIGFSPVFSLSLAIIFILIPTQLGLLLLIKDKESKQSLLKTILTSQKAIKPLTFVLYVILLIAIAGITFALLSSTLTQWMKDQVFSFIPLWARNLEVSANEPQKTLTVLMLIVFGNIIGPLIEEFYFRGFLIHRVQGSFAKKSVLNAFFFALYHFWSPWDVVARTIAVIPHAWITLKTNNLWISIVAHISVNMLSSISLIVLLYF